MGRASATRPRPSAAGPIKPTMPHMNEPLPSPWHAPGQDIVNSPRAMGISMPVHHMGAGRFRDLKTAALVTERLHHLGNIGEIRRQADVVDIGGENVVIASFRKDLTGGGADGGELERRQADR